MLELAAQALKIKHCRAKELLHHSVVTGIELPHWDVISAFIYVFNIYFPVHNSFFPASNPDSGNRPWCRLSHWPRAERGLRVSDTDSLQAHTVWRPHVGASHSELLLFSCWASMEVVWLTSRDTETCPDQWFQTSCTELHWAVSVLAVQVDQYFYRRTGLGWRV